MLLTQKETSAVRGLTDLFCNPRYKAAADPTVAATLLPTHVEAWRETWSQSIIEFEGDDFVKRAINSTLCEI